MHIIHTHTHYYNTLISVYFVSLFIPFCLAFFSIWLLYAYRTCALRQYLMEKMTPGKKKQLYQSKRKINKANPFCGALLLLARTHMDRKSGTIFFFFFFQKNSRLCSNYYYTAKYWPLFSLLLSFSAYANVCVCLCVVLFDHNLLYAPHFHCGYIFIDPLSTFVILHFTI